MKDDTGLLAREYCEALARVEDLKATVERQRGVIDRLCEAIDNLENDDNSIPGHAWHLCQEALAEARKIISN